MSKLSELEKLRDETRKKLKDVHPKRVRRRREEAEDDLKDTKKNQDRILKNQEEARDELEHLYEVLARFENDDPSDDPVREEKYLIAEIDLLEREIKRRQPKIEKIAKERKHDRKRFEELERKAKNAHDWQAKLQKRLRRVLDEIEKEKKELAQKTWPATLSVAELLYHAPPHCHLASPERDKLIQIGRIAVERGIRVGEFPPFDSVECVHTSSSWHYRLDGVIHSCSSSRLDYGGDAGEAMDLNDADGGSDKEVAFYHELVSRY